ncbi:magnesium-transporting ATPase, P-type 1-like [Hibiscus syriacus]|uniref:Magnesium-transporting ATPase, P-type 1-like n=1 Tax=Hibiscus syriacus TaxID=106335 RepID=A0A6A3BQ85_HIBSY|nr:protein MIZU-KUSSEI 1-like [Hibiscus syriacus]KAE8718535.1 magnesium-transporting ATPase, P-type 1-like [Hibiscus syriacus]
MSCPTIASTATHLTNGGVTSVDCQKQVRSWGLLRSIMALLVPTCNRAIIQNPQTKHHHLHTSNSSVITGTIFGYRRGKVRFCIQTNYKSTDPILLLEFAVPTPVLAREMQGGILRITLDCTDSEFSSSMLPLWTMYCNGRKVGYAVKCRPSKTDTDALRLMSSVVVGAGMISGKELENEDELMYLRANFQRIRGSADSESFHLIDPEENVGQELSIFFFRP